MQLLDVAKKMKKILIICVFFLQFCKFSKAESFQLELRWQNYYRFPWRSLSLSLSFTLFLFITNVYLLSASAPVSRARDLDPRAKIYGRL